MVLEYQDFHYHFLSIVSVVEVRKYIFQIPGYIELTFEKERARGMNH